MFAHRLFAAAALIASAASAQVVHLPAYPFIGTKADARVGSSVSGAGDVNGDGFDDVIVGAPTENNASGVTTGVARVYSGRTGAFLRTFYGDSAGDQFGWSVSGAGDVNNDGIPDFIVGAPQDDNTGTDSGSARVFSGANGAILYTFNGDSADDRFGLSVSGAGDVNNDGFDDLIVGAYQDDNTGADSGSARVFSGATGAILYTFNGDAAGDRFGWSVSGAGDVNGDGFDDVIVGARFNDSNGTDSGSAQVFSGATGAVLYTFNGVGAGDLFGWSVSGAGDVNGDGFADLIVGAPFHDANGANSGSARVLSGADGAVLHTFVGDAVGDNLGSSVGGAGDVNGDGFADLIVGVPLADNNKNINSGSARVFSGADGAILYTFNGDAGNDQFGLSVGGAGDVNNDGFDDLIVGTPLADNNYINSGSARVFFSVATCPPPTAPCPGDADGNRAVNFADIANVLANFNLICP
ncbi:MAG: FG-GAP repeat protein [Phycisphaerae bacterium]|nr:FG-GAP repeat protein [Phycisphaerae bacterium]